MKFIINLVAFLAITQLFAQRLPSPEASSLIREVNVPVSHYTGLPSVAVPFYTLEHINGVELSASLSYHPYGVKVQSLASSYGLGWNLQAGGIITRIVQDEPDGQADFVDFSWNVETQYEKVSKKPASSWYTGTSDPNIADGERDVFFFSFPGGSGRFVIDDNGDAYTIPHQDIKIERTTSSFATCEWVITDKDGTVYKFGESGVKEKTKTQQMNSDEVYRVGREYVSGWHLTSVNYANTPEPVTFTYITGSTYDYENYAAYRTLEMPNGIIQDDETKKSDTKITIISPRYLDKINVYQGAIDFDYTTGRSDIPNNGGRRLSSVKLLDHNNNVVSKYDLIHSYFDASDSYYEGGTYGTCSSSDCKRLKLDEIKFGSSDRMISYRKFDYTNDDDFHSSGYDKYELPPRNSAYTDHWGFFNGSTAGTGQNTMVAKIDFVQANSPWENDTDGVSKEANSSFTLAGLLKKIEYPTSGSVLLNFEANSDGSNALGGVRIESIEYDYANGDPNRKIEYDYESVTTFNKPKYSDYFVVNAGPGSIVFLTTSSHSLINLFDVNGSPVSYGKVIEKWPNQGQIEYFFHSLSDRPDTQANEFRYVIGSGSQGGTDLFRYPTTTFYWERGNPDKVIKKSQAGIKVEEVDYEYHFNNSNIKVLSNLTSRITGSSIHSDSDGSSQTDTYNIAEYDLISRPFTVDKKTTLLYSQGREDLSTSSVTDYDYHSHHVTLVDMETTNFSDGRGTRREIFYPYDIKDITDAPSVLSTMESNHMIGVPVQILEYSKINNESYKVTGGSLSEFNKYTSTSSYETFQLHKNYNLLLADELTTAEYNTLVSNSTDYDNIRNAYDLMKTNDFDNQSGLLTSETDNLTGIKVDLAYNAQGLLLTETSNSGLETEKSYGYSHNPMVGISEISDLNNRSTQFEYDELNRLLLSKNNEGNIVERYRYNYGNETNEISANIVISGTNKTNETITFEATDVQMYGPGEYHWLIDGVSKSGQTVTHTFTSSGPELIQLNIVNPEYDAPKTIGSGVSIYDSDWNFSGISGEVSPCLGDTETYTVTEIPGAHTCQTPTYSYSWEYRPVPGGLFQSLPSDTNSVTWNISGGGSDIEIKVTITDGCGASISKTITVDVQNCGFGG